MKFRIGIFADDDEDEGLHIYPVRYGYLHKEDLQNVADWWDVKPLEWDADAVLKEMTDKEERDIEHLLNNSTLEDDDIANKVWDIVDTIRKRLP